jgi:hypothetical protein
LQVVEVLSQLVQHSSTVNPKQVWGRGWPAGKVGMPGRLMLLGLPLPLLGGTEVTVPLGEGEADGDGDGEVVVFLTGLGLGDGEGEAGRAPPCAGQLQGPLTDASAEASAVAVALATAVATAVLEADAEPPASECAGSVQV